ncbi:MAG: pectate lyase [Dysgonamonadaceae bacterium]|nr:pectate lyase [Dysgonamonadaceae bacterium]
MPLSFYACMDNDGIKDLNPVPPTNVAADDSDEIDNDSGSSGNKTPKFPFFSGEAFAFPGAEGYGRKATGGRANGEIYHVTNLNDAGKGSFRDAVSKSYRIIVFDVAGIIRLGADPVVLKSNQTILGQTAPGDGVVLYGGRVSASGANNTIVRYLRIRMGAGYSKQADACGIANGSDIIFDHCSITWGKDENFSVNSDGKGVRPHNITIQNSIIGQGLQNHSCGGLIQTSETEGVTIYRNLYIDNKTRNPKVKGLNQFVNNVLYNWGNGAAYNMGGESEGPSETTIENNYFIVGDGGNWMDDGTGAIVFSHVSPTRPFTGGNALFKTYLTGNYYDKNKDGVLNGIEITQSNWDETCSGSPTFLAERSPLHPAIAGISSAQSAYDWIVRNVGASLPTRDEVDAYLIEELTSLGTKGTIIRNETKAEQFPLAGPGRIASGEKPLDTDNDGMPDVFEIKWGLDKDDPADATEIASNGYANIENYTFSLEFPEYYQ